MTSLTWSLFKFNARTVEPLCRKLFLITLIESCGLGTFIKQVSNRVQVFESPASLKCPQHEFFNSNASVSMSPICTAWF